MRIRKLGRTGLEVSNLCLAAADLRLDEEAIGRLEEVSKLDLVYPYDFHVQVRALMGEQGLES